MDAVSALLVIALVYAVGDVVAQKTKAICSMLFVSGIVFMVGFWSGIPTTLFEDAVIVKFSLALIPMLMVHMGTLMKLRDLKDEWKTVLIALAAIIAAAIALFFLAAPIIGKQYALTAAGPISGGVVATLIMSEAAKAKGLESVLVFVTLLLVLQNFVGLPIASICLSREGRRLRDIFRKGEQGQANLHAQVKSDPEQPTWRLFPPTPKDLRTPFILLMKAMLVGWLAVWFAKVLGGVINQFVMALIFGIIFYEIGFLEHKILDKANSTGLALFALLVPIFMSLNKATPQMVASLIIPIVVAFAISVVGIVAVAFLSAKIFGYSWEMSLAIGVCCLFGFPGTFIVSQEVANAVGETSEERDFILTGILPKMLVSGFTTVTIASVFLAGFLVKFI
ncbi:MAG TPA: hypothetical protein DEP01_08945 [Aminobacterium sp.]|uniref:hypothetical protein n=1 Tax=Aminobacterium TaxID=81466 RepID=UPI000EDE4C2F|nr:hypothetical protein [Aminobacterium sp. UBA4834]HCA41581.1 hypothetical protein [Aminobacterium sp.]